MLIMVANPHKFPPTINVVFFGSLEAHEQEVSMRNPSEWSNFLPGESALVDNRRQTLEIDSLLQAAHHVDGDKVGSFPWNTYFVDLKPITPPWVA